MASKAIDTVKNVWIWQVVLMAIGFVLVLLAGLLQLTISKLHSTTVVTKTATQTITTTGPSAPAGSLVTTVLAAGAVLILAGAFFSRVSKIVIPNVGEVDLQTQADIASKVAVATSDPAKAKQLTVSTSDKVQAEMATQPVAAKPSDDMIQKAFTEAVKELGITLP